jgi:hypothetical protein
MSYKQDGIRIEGNVPYDLIIRQLYLRNDPMVVANISDPSRISSTTKLQVVIGMLSVIIKVGKYLPHIVFSFATLNLTLAILDLAIWGSWPFGVLNVILAIGGFVFSGQLHQRRIAGKHYSSQPKYATMNRRPEQIQPGMIAFE